MKITIEKKNNKFYLEVEKPHYPDNYSPTRNQGREVDKIYRTIERNIEKYHSKEDDLNIQYINVNQMVLLLKNYFELHPDVLKIKIQYKRTYPSKPFWNKARDSKGKKLALWADVFTEDFEKEKIKILKTK